ncbi:MAG: alkaline phosphatase family protein [Deltaproteobacteria bacterium]|nr:alkaline phosphatase family protein [Deltaproteobacteria bacterium]
MSKPSLFALCCALLMSTTTQAAARPRLGVLVVFDQLPVWLLERYAPFFPDGFGGFDDGARFDAFYAYAGTETAPGHATLSTCTLPSVHGIATNSWFVEGKKLYAVDDPTFPTLMAAGAKAKGGRSPRYLMANTLGDAMKTESGGRARVVTLSHKDRSAILTAGHAADLAVWYDNDQGRFTTSTAYADVLPPWLEEAGAALPAATMKSGTWTPLPIPKGLEWLVPVDDKPGEGALKGYDRTFPHDIKDVEPAAQHLGYRLTPHSISDLFTLALRAVDAEKLGADDEPDFLVVSVSTTDVVGHNYGGESLEQLDTLRRADLELRRFLKGLEAKIGRNNFVVGVSSDHGAPQLPQTIISSGLEVKTVTYEDVVDAANKAGESIGGSMALASGKGTPTLVTGKKRVRGFFPPQLFLDEDDLDAAGKQRLRDAIEKAVEALPGVSQVYQMVSPAGVQGPDEDGYGVFMRGSYNPQRSAPIFVRTDPRVVLMETRGQATGTDHGTAYVYDRRVPFLLRGAGVRRGRYSTPVDVRDIAPTLAFLMGVSPPDSCQGRPVPAVGER